MNMLEIVGRLRLEVEAMGKELEDLYSWSRLCPQCSAFLEKTDPAAPWVCGSCGWTSG